MHYNMNEEKYFDGIDDIEKLDGFEPSPEFHAKMIPVIKHILKSRSKMKKMAKEAEEISIKIKNPTTKIYAPEREVIQKDLEQICSVPHRRIGTKYAHEIENYIEQTFKDLDLEVHKEPFKVIDWAASNWKLKLKNQNEEDFIDFPCFYTLNTGFTSKEGITAPLIYVGDGKPKDMKKLDIKGKIVVADIVHPIFPIGLLLKLIHPYYVSDPTNSILSNEKLIMTFALKNFPPQPILGKPREDSVYWQSVRGGALGLILILKYQVSNVNSHWGPYDGSFKPIPSVYVGKYDGIKLMEYINSGETEGTIILEGHKKPSVAHNIWAQLPGQTEENIIISSHHDSSFKGASEDGTGIACVLAQARAWSEVPIDQRPRSLIFAATAGHLYGGIGAEIFAFKYKDSFFRKTLVNINLEHLCCKEVEEDPKTYGYKPTDNIALGVGFMSQNKTLVAHTRKAMESNKFERLILIPENFLMSPAIGEAGHFNAHTGVNVIDLIRSPYYLLNEHDTLDKIDMSKLNPTNQMVCDLINSLMYEAVESFDKDNIEK